MNLCNRLSRDYLLPELFLMNPATCNRFLNCHIGMYSEFSLKIAGIAHGHRRLFGGAGLLFSLTVLLVSSWYKLSQYIDMSFDSITFNQPPTRFARSTRADNIRPIWPDIIVVALRANLIPFVIFQHYSTYTFLKKSMARHALYLN